MQRQKELDAQQKLLKEAYELNQFEVKQDVDALQGVQDLEKEMFELYGNPEQ